jgi:hypothetical protein
VKLITSAAMAAFSAAATMAAEKTGQLIDTLTAAGDRRFFVSNEDYADSGRPARRQRTKSGYRIERHHKMPRAGWPAGTKLANKARAGEITLRRGW